MTIPETPPDREADVLVEAVRQLVDLLPQGWQVDVATDTHEDIPAVDALLNVVAPDGSRLTLLIEAKRSLVTRDVPWALEQLSAAGGAAEDGPGQALVARYLSPNTRERITALGGAYLDATGNIRIASDRPPLFILASGAARDPWRGPGRPRGSLRGAPAARVVRALVDIPPPYTVPKLVELSGASTGATYRVVKFLEDEAYLQRTERGPITSVDWRRLLERWASDYRFDRAGALRRYLAPRGVATALDRLRAADPDAYVVTGSVAAGFYAPYAPPNLLLLHAPRPDDLADTLGLRPVETGANVLVAAHDEGFAFARSSRRDQLTVAAPSQIAADLLGGPGRSPAEAQALLDWMQENEDDWRQP